MGRLISLAAAVAIGVAVTAWYYQPVRRPSDAPVAAPESDDDWLTHLYSRNPKEAADATRRVEELGTGALPIIREALEDAAAERERVKAAMKAAGILGPQAAPVVPLVAARLTEPDFTTEAAIALSFMGRGAFASLKDALGSEDPVVRRESLRSIGKLKERAHLETRAVLPLLEHRMDDSDGTVRAVAATYLGIIHESPATGVPALVTGLADPEPDVRRASATALAAFGADAQPAIPALRKAAVDPDPDVAREAGVTLVKLQGK
jgi:HEAT repeat protein